MQFALNSSKTFSLTAKASPTVGTELGHVNKRTCLDQQSKDKQIPRSFASHSLHRHVPTNSLEYDSPTAIYDSTREPQDDADKGEPCRF